MNLRKHFSTRQTAQMQPMAGSDQVQNNAGGFAWAVDNWTRLDRFLILGTDGGTFYVGERKLTIDNAQAVLDCLAEDGRRTVDRIVEISESGRAAKNDPALFALAMAAADGDESTRKAALTALPKVARIGTHLFHFMHFVEGFRGWGRGLRRAVGNWYIDRPAQSLAYQAIKYQQRDGWSHRDALRLAHPIAPSDAHNRVFNWVTQGWGAIPTSPLDGDSAHQLLWAFEKAKRADSKQEIIQLVTEFGLPWEAVPTKWLREAAVWEALLPKMGLTAMIRNLGRLTNIGLVAPHSVGVNEIERRITDPDALRRARIHPIAVLAALLTYKNGRGIRGKLTWTPVTRLVDALDDAFYSTFGNVAPSNKRLMLALDVSGSMGWPNLAGVPGLSPRVGSAAMALVTAVTEPNYMLQAFSHKFVKLTISPRQRLDGVLKEVDRLNFGATDCALPMVYALENRIPVDAFVVYTDSETWYGHIHPVQALQEYRQKMGIGAKLIVVGMASNGFSIADPRDGGMLDVVGFDTAVPNIMADFIKQ